MAKVIDNLVLAGTKVIVFDIMFDHVSEQDSIMSKSIKNAENNGVKIILAANNIIETGIANKKYRLIKPSKKILKDNDSKIGLVGTVNDNDGFVRRYISYDFNVDESEQEQYFSLALEAVQNYKNEKIIVGTNGLNIGNLFIPNYNKENTFL